MQRTESRVTIVYATMKCGDNGGRKANGDPCNRNCQNGFTRCSQHGGSAPASVAKAQQSLALVRLPAIEALHHIIDQFLSNTCTACGFPSGDTDAQRTVVRAAQVVLDRTQLGPTATVKLTTQSDGDLNLDLLTDDERKEMLAAIAVMKHLKEVLRARALGEEQQATAPRIM